MIDPRPIPCEHETKGVLSTTVLSDFHPLTYEELVELLAIAQDGDWKVASQVQCRIIQAVPGAECPHTINGPVFEKQNKLNFIFTEAHKQRTLKEALIANSLFAIMTEAQ